MSESLEQQALFTWIRNYGVKKYPMLNKIFAIPNGGKRNKITAINLKKEGVLSGVWDIFLPHPNKKYCGLFIEMKYGKNKLTKNQVIFRDGLEDNYMFEVAYNWIEAKEKIINYINEK